jgi:hypothetical protein
MRRTPVRTEKLTFSLIVGMETLVVHALGVEFGRKALTDPKKRRFGKLRAGTSHGKRAGRKLGQK